MTAERQIQNKPLLILVASAALTLAISVALYVEHHGLTQAKARAQAIGLMQEFCARTCATQGLAEKDLSGPDEPVRNATVGNTKFDFTWSGHGKVLLVRIWDNGLTVQTLTQWQAPDQTLPH